MDREYIRIFVAELLTGKKLILLPPGQIAEKIDKTDLVISDEMKLLLKSQNNDILNDKAHLDFNHAGLQPAIQSLSRAIVVLTRDAIVDERKMARIFDNVVLLLSIYWQYEAVLRPESMYVFLRLVLKEKILLV